MEVPGNRPGKSFKDTDGRSSAKEVEIFCQPCKSDGDWLVATGYCLNCNEYFCSTCLKVHRKQALSKRHAILEGEIMPGQYETTPLASTEACSDLCDKHANEIVKFYCSSHDVVGCSDCMVLEHKSCKIDRIQDVSGAYFMSQELIGLQGNVDKFLDDFKQLDKKIHKNNKKIKENDSKLLKDIRSFREEINDYLDKAEADILEELNKTKQRDEKLISDLAVEKASLENEVKEIDNKLKLHANKANELFVAAKTLKGKMKAIHNEIRQMFENSSLNKYVFEKCVDLTNVVEKCTPLGKITELISKKQRPERHAQGTHQLGKIITPKSLSQMEPYFVDEINVKSPDDEYDCAIGACSLLSSCLIALADYTNSCVKVVDIQDKKVVTRYQFENMPNDIATVFGDLLAVCFESEQRVKFLILRQNELEESHELKLNGCCKYISCHKDRYVIVYRGRVEILDTAGIVKTSITSPNIHSIQGITFSPNAQSIFVSDMIYGRKTESRVLKFDVTGNPVAKFSDKDLGKPAGVTVSKDGTVFACNWTENGCIHMISPECKKIKTLMKQDEHLRYPYCVSFCDETSTLIVVTTIKTFVKSIKIS